MKRSKQEKPCVQVLTFSSSSFFFFYKEKVKSKIEYLKLIKFLKNFFNQIKNTWSYLATALFSLLKHNLTVTDSR